MHVLDDSRSMRAEMGTVVSLVLEGSQIVAKSNKLDGVTQSTKLHCRSVHSEHFRWGSCTLQHAVRIVDSLRGVLDQENIQFRVRPTEAWDWQMSTAITAAGLAAVCLCICS